MRNRVLLFMMRSLLIAVALAACFVRAENEEAPVKRCPICHATPCVALQEGQESPYKHLFEDPLYQKLKKALSTWSAKQKNGFTPVGETCDARLYHGAGCSVSDSYVYQTVAIVGDCVELYDYLNHSAVIEKGTTHFKTTVLTQLNQFTHYGHFTTDYQKGTHYYVCRLPKRFFELDFNSAFNMLVSADEVIRDNARVALCYLDFGYAPERAIDMAFSKDPEEPISVYDSLPTPKRSSLIPIAYGIEEDTE